jgi:hypothetical protein
MADGSFKTVELGVEGNLDADGEDWRQAQADLYRHLGAQLRYLFSSNGAMTQDGSRIGVQPLPAPPPPQPAALPPGAPGPFQEI